MTYIEFRDKWLGKGINFDNAFGNQCQDVYRMYCREVLDIPQSPPVKGAKYVWDTYLKDYFERITNTPDGSPEQGDIVIWSVGTFGHIAICDHADKKFLTSFEQNWTEAGTAKDGKGVTELRQHNYANVLGWLKPKNDELKACLELLHNKVIPEKEALQREFDTYRAESEKTAKDKDEMIASITADRKKFRGEGDILRAENEKLKQEDQDRIKLFAEKLNVVHFDWAAIISEVDKFLTLEDQKLVVDKALFAASEELRGARSRIEELERLLGAVGKPSGAKKGVNIWELLQGWIEKLKELRK